MNVRRLTATHVEITTMKTVRQFTVFLLLSFGVATVCGRSPQFGGTEFYERMRQLAGPTAPGTVRDLQAFHAVSEGTSIPDLLRRVGTPDIDVGSGLHVYEYLLIPEGRIRVGTRDDNNILYIDYLPDGVSEPKRILPRSR